MKRIPLKDTERYTLERFRQCKKTERHLAWLKSRKAGVGGSDMSTILGLNAFKTPYDLWLEKTGRAEPGGHLRQVGRHPRQCLGERA
jgi:predicted phage-related endonuclease